MRRAQTETLPKRATATKSLYHELDLDRFEEREHVLRIQDPGVDTWEDKVSIILSPERDCHHGELVQRVVAHLEARLGQKIEWAAWSHRDVGSPHAHLIIKDPRRDPTSRREFDRIDAAVQEAARVAYSFVRARQMHYARTHGRGQGVSR